MRTVNPKQHALKRAKILAAAAEEFAANGMDGTSTAAICRRAGIGSGTLFHYFPTKRDIFHAVFAEEFERTAEIYEKALTAAQPEAGLDLVVDHLIADLTNPLAPGLTAAALLQVYRDDEFARLLAADDERRRAVVAILLRRMAERGHRPAFGPEGTARWFQRLFDASFLSTGDNDFDPAKQADELRKVIAWLVGRQSS
jgi:AcrR family transcriptional regulator